MLRQTRTKWQVTQSLLSKIRKLPFNHSLQAEIVFICEIVSVFSRLDTKINKHAFLYPVCGFLRVLYKLKTRYGVW